MFAVNGDRLPGPLIIGTFEKRAPGQTSDVIPVYGVYQVRSQYSRKFQQSDLLQDRFKRLW